MWKRVCGVWMTGLQTEWNIWMGGSARMGHGEVHAPKPMFASSVRPLFPLLCQFKGKRGDGECRGGQGVPAWRWAPIWAPSRARARLEHIAEELDPG